MQNHFKTSFVSFWKLNGSRSLIQQIYWQHIFLIKVVSQISSRFLSSTNDISDFTFIVKCEQSLFSKKVLLQLLHHSSKAIHCRHITVCQWLGAWNSSGLEFHNNQNLTPRKSNQHIFYVVSLVNKNVLLQLLHHISENNTYLQWH